MIPTDLLPSGHRAACLTCATCPARSRGAVGYDYAAAAKGAETAAHADGFRRVGNGWLCSACVRIAACEAAGMEAGNG